jgi:3-deoxy-D-manno-octulosonic-acid transferase
VGKALSLGVRCTLGLYGLAWRAALPILHRNKRLAEGWAERTLASGPLPQAELWLQAASGGEAYLAWEMLRRLPKVLRDRGAPAAATPLRVLVTTFTSQGLGVLEQAKAQLAADFPGQVELLPAFFPFDLPGRMARAIASVRPRAVVLLETEIWPGLLAACHNAGVPALLLNGRMTEKSVEGYQRLSWLWPALAPKRVLAVSEPDAARFATVFGMDRGSEGVDTMPNIKFDRLRFDAGHVQPEFARLLPKDAPFVVLGSVRKEEEEDVLRMVRGLIQARPDAVIGLFPRHMQRVCIWERLLREAGIPFALRSETEHAVAAGSVLIWDVFGELGGAFSLARAAFLGGSLAPLGGQNFLEPLAFGVGVVTGPSWSNFAWVGEEIFAQGLVRRAQDWQGALRGLCGLLESSPERSDIREKAEIYAQSRRGGAEAACQLVAECLICA